MKRGISCVLALALLLVAQKRNCFNVSPDILSRSKSRTLLRALQRADIRPRSNCRIVLAALKSSADSDEHELSRPCLQRRHFFRSSALVSAGLFSSFASAETVPTGSSDGNLPELPPEAVRSYLQYRGQLQTSLDYYIFDLQELLGDTNEWGSVGEVFATKNSRGGQGSPSRIEREFTNVIRILGLSMPPDAADDMFAAQDRFAVAMSGIGKVTSGIRRDLPVEIEKDAVPKALRGWEDGRVALNDFLLALNTATGLNELRLLPPSGPNQFKEYGRSERKYVELKKKIKLCQNRGGPALSQAWGQLMVVGTVQESYCGMPDMNEYFYQ